MSNRPIHFEVQADDAERAKKFYESAFGWKIEKSTMPGVGMDYWMIGTAPKGSNEPGIDGGLYQRKDNPMRKLNSFDCTILVDDMDKVIVAIKAGGGKIQPWDGKEKWEMKGLGWFSRAVDTEGNVFGLLQATDWKP
jgi:predicted enzyme related to lactoylglutathione lyase